MRNPNSEPDLIKFVLLFLISMPVIGCSIRTYISAEGDFPDIRTIPSREEAVKDRQNHKNTEALQRKSDLVELEKDLKSARTRDQQLRNQTAPQKIRFFYF